MEMEAPAKCLKCGEPMPPPAAFEDIFERAGIKFMPTGWQCPKCGHNNAIKRRKKQEA